MKKRIALLLAALMIASLISVPVMAAEANLAGTWYAQSMEMDGTAVDGSTMASMGMSFTLTLNEDGTAVLSMNDQEKECTWEGSTLIVNEEPAQMELVDGTIRIEINGAALVFGKEAPSAASVSLAPAVQNPELSDFNGTWNAVTYFAMGIPLPIKIGMSMEFCFRIEDGAVAFTQMDYDLNNNSELTGTIEKEFTATLNDDGTLFVDFNGEEDILKNIYPGGSGMRLTLHEDGQMTGEIPEMTEAMELLAAMSQAQENTDAEAADAADAPAEEESASDGSSSGGEAMSAYIIFEKAE